MPIAAAAIAAVAIGSASHAVAQPHSAIADIDLPEGSVPCHYAITALWTAAHYNVPVTIVVASNAEYGVVQQFGVWEKTPNVPGLEIPGLDIVGTAASYGVDAHEAHSTDEVFQLVKDGIADRKRPTLINARVVPVGDSNFGG